MIPKAKPGAYVTVAMGWVQERPGFWLRYLVRMDRQRRPQVSRLTWLDGDLLFCPHCLSQDLEMVQAQNPVEVRCGDCKTLSIHELEPDQDIEMFAGEDEPDDEEDEGPDFDSDFSL